MSKRSDRPKVSLRARSPLQNGLVIASGCLFAVVGISGLTVGRASGDWSALDAILCCLSLALGGRLVLTGARQGVVLLGDQILIRRPGTRTIHLERPVAVHFDSYVGIDLEIGVGFVLDCLAIENEDGSLTQVPGIGVWRWFPGHDRINLRRALVIDDMICRIQTGASRALTAERREHCRQLQRPPAGTPKHQASA